jgi:hypothetical protein
MKLVGGDSGRCEARSSSSTSCWPRRSGPWIDVLFDEPGELVLEHHTPDRTYPLAAITVTGEPATPSLRREFEALRSDPELAAERHDLARHLEAAPNKTLAFVAEMDFDAADDGAGGPVVYTCPMHPAVIADSCRLPINSARRSAQLGTGRRFSASYSS